MPNGRRVNTKIHFVAIAVPNKNAPKNIFKQETGPFVRSNKPKSPKTKPGSSPYPLNPKFKNPELNEISINPTNIYCELNCFCNLKSSHPNKT